MDAEIVEHVVQPDEHDDKIDPGQLRQHLVELHRVVDGVGAGLAHVADPCLRIVGAQQLLQLPCPGIGVVQHDVLGRAAADGDKARTARSGHVAAKAVAVDDDTGGAMDSGRTGRRRLEHDLPSRRADVEMRGIEELPGGRFAQHERAKQAKTDKGIRGEADAVPRGGPLIHRRHASRPLPGRASVASLPGRALPG